MDERLRIAVYRRIAEATETRALDDLQSELLDRFGPIPDPILRLIQIARIRCHAAAARITMVETRGQRLLLFRGPDPLTGHNHQLPRLRSSHPDVKLQEIETYLDKITESNT
jgi:transcription-repair coupling factor (superfamily II helicase)